MGIDWHGGFGPKVSETGSLGIERLRDLEVRCHADQQARARRGSICPFEPWRYPILLFLNRRRGWPKRAFVAEMSG